MARKDRPAALNAKKPRRAKNAPAGADTPATPPQPPPLNHHVTVHIIAVPPAQIGTPASIPLAPKPNLATPPAETAAPNPTAAAVPPATRTAPAPLPGPGAQTPKPAALSPLPAWPATDPTAPAPARPITPAAGTPVLAADQPSPVHKSAQNLGPLEQMLWAARLQKAKDVVASQMKVTVTGGKLVRRYTALDHDDGLFEIQTNKGFYVAVLSKTGEFSIYWRHDRKAY